MEQPKQGPELQIPRLLLTFQREFGQSKSTSTKLGDIYNFLVEFTLEMLLKDGGSFAIYKGSKLIKCWQRFFKLTQITLGCTVAQLVALLPCSKKVLGSIPVQGLSAWSLHVLPVHAWVLTGYSGFLPQSKGMPVRLIGLSNLPLSV
ncbi:hypothetical protein ILYODFUR_023282 [Ilyodon furcidens]|uniref:Uncharacterized protein n=1 Tax=Ilyodon furcidens TaxID=33524 RepID=A0ABV0TM46_9TELE